LLSKAVDVHLFTLGSVVGIERDSVCGAKMINKKTGAI